MFANTHARTRMQNKDILYRLRLYNIHIILRFLGGPLNQYIWLVVIRWTINNQKEKEEEEENAHKLFSEWSNSVDISNFYTYVVHTLAQQDYAHLNPLNRIESNQIKIKYHAHT